MGYPTFSCDSIYKAIIITKEYIKQIQAAFPSCIENDTINKVELSKLVFSNPKARETLNEISHPLILKTLFKKMEYCDNKIVFAEVPLLFEANLEDKFDKVLVIQRNLNNRIKAIHQRDNLPQEEIEKRIQAQFDYSSKNGEARLKKCAAIIIENNGDIAQLNASLQSFLNSLKN